MLLAANVVIATTTGGYFGAPAEANPLLNTWSLSVEEQFCLVFPALLVLSWIAARRTTKGRWASLVVIGLLTAASLGLAVFGSSALAPDRGALALGFYSPLTRAWEFGAGALLALTAADWRARGIWFTRLRGWAGLALIATSCLVITESTPFPGLWTLLPVVGTLLLLVDSEQPTIVTRLLSSRPMVRVGDWSYSIYLWHWPLIVFAVFLWPTSPMAALLAAGLSLVPAVASFTWVEQPLRVMQVHSRRGATFLIAAVVVPPLMVASGVWIAADKYWLPRYESGDIPVIHPGETSWEDFYAYMEANYYPCTPVSVRDGAPKWEGVPRCWQSQPDEAVTFALVGDSHAEQLFLGLAEALPNENVAYYITEGLPVASDDQMVRIADYVAGSPSIRSVVVSSWWAARTPLPEEDLVSVLTRLRSGGANIYLTNDVPTFPFEAVRCKYGKAPLLPFTECSMDVGEFARSYAGFRPALDRVASEVPGARVIETADFFCSPETCDMTRDGRLLFRDTNHLNMEGSRFLAKQLVEDHPEWVSTPLQSGD